MSASSSTGSQPATFASLFDGFFEAENEKCFRKMDIKGKFY